MTHQGAAPPLLPTATGARSEPWIVAVLVGNRSALWEEDHRQLQRVAPAEGQTCGVQLVLLDVPMTVNASVETVHLREDGAASGSMTGPAPPVGPVGPFAVDHRAARADRHRPGL